jgi:glycosyltransferase involved in cell wall biosynthesis
VEQLKILYFHQHFSTPLGKTGTRSYEMAQALVKKGHAVLMVCGSYDAACTGLKGDFRKGTRRGWVDGIEVLELHMPYSNKQGFVARTLIFLRFSVMATWIALKERYDLIFCTSTPLTIAIPGVIARWIRRKPFVFEVRDLWPELPRAMGVITNPLVLGLMSILEFVAYRSADLCIALAPGISEGIVKRGVPDHRIKLVSNGCDLDLFDDESIKPKRPKNLEEVGFLALFCGAHGMANGLDAVLDAALELKRRGRSDINLVLVGQGRMKSELMKQAQEKQLDNICFLDSIPKRELVSLMKSADLGLMILANVPAFYTGTSPNKFFDYIAAGLPVLNNYPGWLADLITENDCGFAVMPENPSAFADQIEMAADDRSSLESKGNNAKALARRCFDRDLLAKDWIEVVESAYSLRRKSC